MTGGGGYPRCGAARRARDPLNRVRLAVVVLIGSFVLVTGVVSFAVVSRCVRYLKAQAVPGPH